MRIHFGLLLTLVVFYASAQDYEKFGMHPEDLPQGIAVGSKAPPIELEDSEGQAFNLNKKLKEGPVVLYFYRGNWCPYCSRQLANLSDSLHFILEKGATVVAISPEAVKNLRESKEITEGPIVFLRDSQMKVMEAYDVDFHVTEAYQDKILTKMDIDLKEFNDQENVIFPVPATYVINQEGKIVYRYFDVNYRERAPVVEVLKALENL